jgi:hypothetical protein
MCWRASSEFAGPIGGEALQLARHLASVPANVGIGQRATYDDMRGGFAGSHLLIAIRRDEQAGRG